MTALPQTLPLSYRQHQYVRVFVALGFAGAGGLSCVDLGPVVGSGAERPASKTTVTRVCDEMAAAGYVTRTQRHDLPRSPVYYVGPRQCWQGKAGGWERDYSEWCAKKRAEGERI